MLRPTLAIMTGLFLAACTTVEVWPPEQPTPGRQAGREGGQARQRPTAAESEVTFAVSEEEGQPSGAQGAPGEEMKGTPREGMKGTEETAGADSEKLNIVLSEDLRAMCDMQELEGSFEVGSASISEGTKSALDSLASCLEKEEAADRKLDIVGYTDPRGDEDFNMELGQRRAEAVASELRSAGIADDRINTESRGESEATGTDPESWAKDRKVEISLAE